MTESLVEYLVAQYFPYAIEKGLFGKRRVRLGALFTVELYLFETGALLGRSYCSTLDILAVTFSEPGRNKEAARFLLEQAEKRLQLYGGEPECVFFDFFLRTKMPDLSTEEGVLALTLSAKEEIPLIDASAGASVELAEGIGFGARYPALTESMFRRSYENADLSRWEEYRAYGLDAPERPERVTLEEREREIVFMVTAFISQNYPELLEPLGLELA